MECNPHGVRSLLGRVRLSGASVLPVAWSATRWGLGRPLAAMALEAAAAIGEPARARMLYSLMDNHARTATELAIIADVSPSTASAHLSRLTSERLLKVLGRGRHRYYSLEGLGVAGLLEALSVLARLSRQIPSHYSEPIACGADLL